MSKLIYYDIIFVDIILFMLCSVISVFFFTNNTSLPITNDVTSSMPQPQLLRTGLKELILNFGWLINFFIFLFFYFFKGVAANIWFSHLYISNTNLFMFMLISVLFLPLYKILLLNLQILRNIQLEYNLTLIMLNIILPIIFFATNILTFYLILEVIASLVLYQFITGKDWELISTNRAKSFFFNINNTPYASYINIIFLQYWISFFSSVLLTYSMLIFLYYYGTTEWVLLDFFFSINNTSWFLNLNYGILIVAFMLKLGIAPLHFYKIEIYKSLPYISILFYTLYFFFIFFIFFIFLICIYLQQASVLWHYMILIFVLVGSFYLLFTLFDVNAVKSFFAYSTVVNSLVFLCLLISII